MEWEYGKEVGATPEEMEKGFVNRGQTGWELVSVIHNPDSDVDRLEWLAYFKRVINPGMD
jgi:hypothetical protein